MGLLIPTAILLGVLKILNAPWHQWNGSRLLKTFLFVGGGPLYQAEGHGPLVAGVNGPVAPWVYLPAVVVREPTAAIIVASAVAGLWFYGPAVAWFRSQGRGQAAGTVALPVLLFFFLTQLMAPTALSSFLVHADAPALGLVLCSLWAVLGEPSRRNGAVAVGCAVLACGSKITVLPVLGALPLVAWNRHGGRAALRLAVVLWGTLVVAGMAAWARWGSGFVFANLSTSFFSPWVASALRPDGEFAVGAAGRLKSIITGLGVLVHEGAPVILLLVCFAMMELLKEKEPKRGRGEAKAALWFALFLVPPSVLGRIKFGGDANTLSPCLYFAALGAAFLARDCLLAVDSRRGSRAMAVLVAGVAFLTLPLFYGLGMGAARLAGNPHSAAYRSLRVNGDIHFPEFPLSTWLATGTVHHYWGSVCERFRTHYRLDSKFFDVFSPKPDRILFWESARGPISTYFPGYTAAPPDPSLPGWALLARN